MLFSLVHTPISFLPWTLLEELRSGRHLYRIEWRDLLVYLHVDKVCLSVRRLVQISLIKRIFCHLDSMFMHVCTHMFYGHNYCENVNYNIIIFYFMEIFFTIFLLTLAFYLNTTNVGNV